MKTIEKVTVTIRGHGAITGEPFAKDVTGVKVGYFVIHRGTGNKKGKWVATHPTTGMAAVTAPIKEVAEWAARRLSDLGVDFDAITTIEQSKALDPAILQEIYLITGAARMGGMA